MLCVGDVKRVIVITTGYADMVRRNHPSVCDTRSGYPPCVVSGGVPVVKPKVDKLSTGHSGTVSLIILTVIGNQGSKAIIPARDNSAATGKAAVLKSNVLVKCSANILPTRIQELNVHMNFCSTDWLDNNLRISRTTWGDIIVHDFAISCTIGNFVVNGLPVVPCVDKAQVNGDTSSSNAKRNKRISRAIRIIHAGGQLYICKCLGIYGALPGIDVIMGPYTSFMEQGTIFQRLDIVNCHWGNIEFSNQTGGGKDRNSISGYCSIGGAIDRKHTNGHN